MTCTHTHTMGVQKGCSAHRLRAKVSYIVWQLISDCLRMPIGNWVCFACCSFTLAHMTLHSQRASCQFAQVLYCYSPQQWGVAHIQIPRCRSVAKGSQTACKCIVYRIAAYRIFFVHADWQLGLFCIVLFHSCTHDFRLASRQTNSLSFSLSLSIQQCERAQINRLAIILAILICNANSWGGRLLTSRREAREN